MKSIPTVYTSFSPSGSGPGILALHAWWGLNPFFRSFCDRLAQEGYTVAAPDLYHGSTASSISEAEKLSSELKMETAGQEITQAAQQLAVLCQSKPLGLVGFSLGGYLALWLAEKAAVQISAVAIFYAARPGDYSLSPAAFQFHMAESDPYESDEGVKKLEESLKTSGKTSEFFHYPGTSHWFFESDQTKAYHPASAQLAWKRMIAFLNKRLK